MSTYGHTCISHWKCVSGVLESTSPSPLSKPRVKIQCLGIWRLTCKQKIIWITSVLKWTTMTLTLVSCWPNIRLHSQFAEKAVLHRTSTSWSTIAFYSTIKTSATQFEALCFDRPFILLVFSMISGHTMFCCVAFHVMSARAHSPIW